MANAAIGDTLPNGAIVLNVLEGAQGIYYLGYMAGGFSPFVTWAALDGQPDSTYGGNYFSTLLEAAQNLEDRAKRAAV